MVNQFTNSLSDSMTVFDSIVETILSWFAPRFIEKRDELARLVNTDALTGLANRRAFDLAAATAKREGLAVILFDANNFGLVNKMLGHATGDAILKRYADVLANVARKYGCRAFRLGGDEFVIVCRRRFASQIRDAVEYRALPQRFANFTVSLSGEIGATVEDADSRLQQRKSMRKTEAA